MINFSPKFEAPKSQENPGERLGILMEKIASKTQAELLDTFGDSARDLLGEDNAINMRSFLVKSGGNFFKEEVKHDERMNHDKELLWSGADNDNVRKYYKDKFGCDTTEELLAQYKESRLNHRGTIVEMAITSILYKFLHDKYIVMRSSTFDDYENGVDNVIVHKETGEVICAFDEVYDSHDHERVEAKDKKILNKAMKGGVKIKYGFSLESEGDVRKLVKQEIKNVPAFYLAMSDVQLDALLLNKDIDSLENISDEERIVFTKLLASLESQVTMLKSNDIPENISSQLDKFLEALHNITI